MKADPDKTLVLEVSDLLLRLMALGKGVGSTASAGEAVGVTLTSEQLVDLAGQSPSECSFLVCQMGGPMLSSV